MLQAKFNANRLNKGGVIKHTKRHRIWLDHFNILTHCALRDEYTSSRAKHLGVCKHTQLTLKMYSYILIWAKMRKSVRRASRDLHKLEMCPKWPKSRDFGHIRWQRKPPALIGLASNHTYICVCVEKSTALCLCHSIIEWALITPARCVRGTPDSCVHRK